MSDYVVRPLTIDTWQAFDRLVERHGGIWGGCWCLEFHPEGGDKGVDRRALKERRVRDGEAHAALVFDGEECVGWCQFGSPEELPRIKFGKAYRAEESEPPDWRITCFFVDKAYRHTGVAEAALRGALKEIAHLGGAQWRAHRRMSPAERSPTPSCTTPPSTCSNGRASPASASSARTTGWYPSEFGPGAPERTAPALSRRPVA